MKHWNETGLFSTPVAGCTNYRDAIQEIAKNGTARTYVTCEAELIPESENQYDANAIMVQIQGRKVGYIPREYLPIYHGIFEKLGAGICPMTCMAAIVGGATLIDGDRQTQYEYQIELDIPDSEDAKQKKTNATHSGPHKHSIEAALFWRGDDHCLLIARIDLDARKNHRKTGELWGKAQWDHLNLYLDNAQGIGNGHFITNIPKSVLDGKFGGTLPCVKLLFLEKTTGCFELTRE